MGRIEAPAILTRESALKPLRSSRSPREQRWAVIGLVQPCCALRASQLLVGAIREGQWGFVRKNKSLLVVNAGKGTKWLHISLYIKTSTKNFHIF